MPYCRRCGTKLEDNAYFCHKCGTPAQSYPFATPSKQVAPVRKDPIIIAGIILITVLVAATLIVAFLAVPISMWSTNRSLEENTANIRTLNLNFETNIGQVRINPLKIDNNNIGIYVQANGSRGILDESDPPLTITFDNQTQGELLIVNSKVLIANKFSMQTNLAVEIFINPELNLNLNVTTDNGSINLAADRAATFQTINLQATAGSVEATIYNATITGNLSMTTNAGSIYFGLSQSNSVSNNTVNLHSNAGSVSVDISQTQTMQGNLKIESQTNLGSVNIGVEVDDSVAARITSNASLGSINVQGSQNFSGNHSSLQSNNYPASSNIEINSSANLGSININANYLSHRQPNIVKI